MLVPRAPHSGRRPILSVTGQADALYGAPSLFVARKASGPSRESAWEGAGAPLQAAALSAKPCHGPCSVPLSLSLSLNWKGGVSRAAAPQACTHAGPVLSEGSGHVAAVLLLISTTLCFLSGSDDEKHTKHAQKKTLCPGA